MEKRQEARTVSFADKTLGYVVSHSRYPAGNYTNDIDDLLKFTNLKSQNISLKIMNLKMEGYPTGECEADDQLIVTGIDDAICSNNPSNFNFTIPECEISFHFVTNKFTNNSGFLIEFTCEFLVFRIGSH